MALENRLSAALFFKNAISKYWSPEEGDVARLDKALLLDTKDYIKQNFAKLLMCNPKKIGENLADIANVIGKGQLNEEWPGFLPVRNPSNKT